MGEAIISRGYSPGADGSGGASNYELKTEIITTNTLWVVPKAINQNFGVRIFGGGGGGCSTRNGGGGGGGCMNNGFLNLAQGSTVQINIGAGGGYGNSGGTSIFGSYFSALGGQGTNNTHGARGGSGGGSGMITKAENGGDGYQFGGGGGTANKNALYNVGYGGNGGYWGGAGGTVFAYYSVEKGNYIAKNNGNDLKTKISSNYKPMSINSRPYYQQYSENGYGLGGNGGYINNIGNGLNNIICFFGKWYKYDRNRKCGEWIWKKSY